MNFHRIAAEKILVAGLWAAAGAFASIAASAAPILTVKVDCAQGRTVAHALGQGDERKPLVVIVQGTCNESVTIDRDDVTLLGNTAAGGTVNGPDPAIDTITVTASRVTIDRLRVTGGRNGITATGAKGMAVRNSLVENTGRTGIAYTYGASGIVDGCTVQNNPRDGVVIESASATVTNNLVTLNGRNGVNVVNGASSRIGIDSDNVLGGNVISSNASSGINLFTGSAAFVAGNTISGNGTIPGSGRNGIQVTSATAIIIGGNTITGNPGTGVSTRSASVTIGDTSFGVSSANTITGNGSNPTGAGGVFGFLGSTALIRDAVISDNTGSGVILSTGSTGQMFANTIQNNTGDGIRLVIGSGLFLSGPNTSTVTGNAGWGLNCTDGESSVLNTSFLNPVMPNTLGGVNPACTGF